MKFFTQVNANTISDANTSQEHFKNQKHNNKRILLMCALRASTADVVKKMLFCHTKHLLYYFTTSFYNIAFIRCFIFQFYTLK